MQLFGVFENGARRRAPTGTPLSPYGEGSQVYASFLRQERRHTRAWQGVAACALVAALWFGWLFLQAATSSRVAVKVVEVDTLGSVRSVQDAGVPYVPTDAAIAKQLSDFLSATRGLSVDPVIVGERVRWASAVVTPAASEPLSDYFREHDPKTRIGTQAVSVDILRTMHPSPTSWDVTWRETTTTLPANQPAKTEVWTGLFTVVVRAPKNEYEVQVNPLGLWIEHFDWQRPAQ